MRRIFRDRTEAGRLLASELSHYADCRNVLVLGLPRGGVPVAFEVARELRAPLDVFVVRKLGVPGQREFAMGAIAGGGVRMVNEHLVRQLQLPPGAVESVMTEEERELKRREMAYRGASPQPEMGGKIVILIDDGVATGSTMQAAVAALKKHGPERLVVAVPTASKDACRELRGMVNELIALMTPEPFHGVGCWYENFRQMTDAEVTALLDRARTFRGGPAIFKGAAEA